MAIPTITSTPPTNSLVKKNGFVSIASERRGRRRVADAAWPSPRWLLVLDILTPSS
jgi:hypothetical protein